MTHPAFFIFYYNLPTNYCCSPRGEQPDRLLNGNLTLLFQSTPSLRRATYCDSSQWTTLGISIHALLAESDLYKCPSPDRSKYFNPRSPCGERHTELAEKTRYFKISILALLAESDWCGDRVQKVAFRFQSTLSLRRATQCCCTLTTTYKISIHALLAESDSKRAQVFLVHIQFLVYLFSRFKNNSYILHIF